MVLGGFSCVDCPLQGDFDAFAQWLTRPYRGQAASEGMSPGCIGAVYADELLDQPI
jgi:hypothetical protein